MVGANAERGVSRAHTTWSPGTYRPDDDARRSVAVAREIKTSDLKNTVVLYDAHDREIERDIVPMGFRQRK